MKKAEYKHIMHAMTVLYEFGACDCAKAEIKMADLNNYMFKIESVKTGLVYFMENLPKQAAIKLFIYCFAIKIPCKVDNKLFFNFVTGD